MEVFKQWKMFGLFFYVSSIRMKRRRMVDEKLRNRSRTLRKCKKLLYAEQDGCCADCGAFFTEDGLEIHHLVGVSEAPNLMLAMRNMVLLCPACHKRRHLPSGKLKVKSEKLKMEDGKDGELQ